MSQFLRYPSINAVTVSCNMLGSGTHMLQFCEDILADAVFVKLGLYGPNDIVYNNTVYCRLTSVSVGRSCIDCRL